MRTIRGVRSVARSLAECNNGWIASSSVQTRKVALCLASTAGSMISSCATPIAATRGPSPFTSRRSFVPLSKTNIRHCSSHASSSLVKMATDRDILSDEYVPPHSPYSTTRARPSLNKSFQCQAYQLRHLPLRPPATRTMDLPRSCSDRPRRQEVHQVHHTQHPRAQGPLC